MAGRHRASARRVPPLGARRTPARRTGRNAAGAPGAQARGGPADDRLRRGILARQERAHQRAFLRRARTSPASLRPGAHDALPDRDRVGPGAPALAPIASDPHPGDAEGAARVHPGRRELDAGAARRVGSAGARLGLRGDVRIDRGRCVARREPRFSRRGRGAGRHPALALCAREPPDRPPRRRPRDPRYPRAQRPRRRAGAHAAPRARCRGDRLHPERRERPRGSRSRAVGRAYRADRGPRPLVLRGPQQDRRAARGPRGGPGARGDRPPGARGRRGARGRAHARLRAVGAAGLRGRSPGRFGRAPQEPHVPPRAGAREAHRERAPHGPCRRRACGGSHGVRRGARARHEPLRLRARTDGGARCAAGAQPEARRDAVAQGLPRARPHRAGAGHDHGASHHPQQARRRAREAARARRGARRRDACAPRGARQRVLERNRGVARRVLRRGPCAHHIGDRRHRGSEDR